MVISTFWIAFISLENKTNLGYIKENVAIKVFAL